MGGVIRRLPRKGSASHIPLSGAEVHERRQTVDLPCPRTCGSCTCSSVPQVPLRRAFSDLVPLTTAPSLVALAIRNVAIRSRPNLQRSRTTLPYFPTGCRPRGRFGG